MRIGAWAAARWDRESLRPDLGRGVRCMLSYMAPVLLAVVGRLPVEMIFAAVAAQSIANVDVRGPYALRATLLLSKTVIIALAAGLGALTGHPLALALGATALVAAASGLWRHLSTEYGPSLAVASGLVFYIALAGTRGVGVAERHVMAALVGGCWGTFLQVSFWPIQPEHPLRVAVSDSWLAAADFFAALAASAAGPVALPPGAAGSARPSFGLHSMLEAATGALAAPSAALLSPAGQAEGQLRQVVDKTYQSLDTADGGRHKTRRHVEPLRELTRTAARLALRVSAYHSARGALHLSPGVAADGWREAEQPLLTALQNLARTVAVAAVSRAPAHLATVNVRVRRSGHLARALRERAAPLPDAGAVVDALAELEAFLPALSRALAAATERAGERSAFSLELVELSGAALRPLALALNFHGQWDRSLVRFIARSGTLALIGVAAMKIIRLPHGYWLPFTMLIVLQPDYGSTRQKAAQRLAGTVGGSIIGSLLLYLHLPFPALMAGVAVCCFVFGYHLKRNYALAVVFITVFVVALTEAFAPQTLALTAERLSCTLAGGLLALLAAVLFWPVWERDRVRPILASGLRANADLLRQSWAAGARLDTPAVVRARRCAESANAEVFSSLQRMAGDPRDRQDRLEHLATLANGNQRLTSALNLALLRSGGEPPNAAAFVEPAARALEALADGFAQGSLPQPLASSRSALAASAPPALARAAAELSALILEAEETLPASAGTTALN